MVAEPQQAAVTNAVLLGALWEEEKENLKHVLLTLSRATEQYYCYTSNFLQVSQ
jgi:hypothetical protein